MAERSEKAQERVREQLQKNPAATTQELQDAAASVEPSVAELSRRQFNAGYVLPLKRTGVGGRKKGRAAGQKKQGGRRKQTTEEAAPAPSRAGARRTQERSDQGDQREQVRATMMEFARDFSEAESRSEIVAVLADLDRYVDRIVGARA